MPYQFAAGPERPALLLGPLAVASDVRRCGIGGELIRHALDEARRRGHRAVLLVGDAPYYGRFGFTAQKTGALSLPGPYARERLLARELVPGALEGARGRVRAIGRREPKSAIAVRLADLTGDALASRAA
jgi:predicted N-acetyltransferase YhbS